MVTGKTGSDENLIFTLSKNDNSNRKLKNWCASAGIKKKFHSIAPGIQQLH